MPLRIPRPPNSRTDAAGACSEARRRIGSATAVGGSGRRGVSSAQSPGAAWAWTGRHPARRPLAHAFRSRRMRGVLSQISGHRPSSRVRRCARVSRTREPGQLLCVDGYGPMASPGHELASCLGAREGAVPDRNGHRAQTGAQVTRRACWDSTCRWTRRVRVILASDAIFTMENLGPPARPTGYPVSAVDAARTVEEIRAHAERLNARVWRGHDMNQFMSLRNSTQGWYEQGTPPEKRSRFRAMDSLRAGGCRH